MRLLITVEGKQYEVDVQVLEGEEAPTKATGAAEPAPEPATAPQASAPAAEPSVPDSDRSSGGAEVTAPVAGSVFDVKVKPGDEVQQHDTLLVLEAMKMESNVPAPHAGTVREVLVKVGDSVSAGQVLVRL